MKRVLSLFLVICFLSFSILTASAVEPVPPSVYDLLYSVEYHVASLPINSTFEIPTGKCTYHSITFTWVSSVYDSFPSAVIGIQSGVAPSNVYLVRNDSFTSSTFLYSLNGVHYFEFSNLPAVREYSIRVDFSTNINSMVSIDSFYGYIDHSIPITEVDFFNNIFAGDPELGYRYIITGDHGHAGFPLVSHWDGPYIWEDEVMLYAECYYNVSSPVSHAESLTYLVYCVGSLSNVGARLQDSSGNVLALIPSFVTPCGDSQIVVEFDEEMYRLHSYIVTLDLSGYDLTDKVISFSFEVSPVNGSSAMDYAYGYYAQVTAVSVMPVLTDPNILSLFSHWLHDRFDDVIGQIDYWCNRIVTALSPDSGQVDDFNQDLQDSNNDLNDAQGVLDSVLLPSPDDFDFSLDIDPSVITLSVSPLAALFSNDYVLMMMGLSFTMAFIGFVLFGKR